MGSNWFVYLFFSPKTIWFDKTFLESSGVLVSELVVFYPMCNIKLQIPNQNFQKQFKYLSWFYWFPFRNLWLAKIGCTWTVAWVMHNFGDVNYLPRGMAGKPTVLWMKFWKCQVKNNLWIIEYIFPKFGFSSEIYI